MKIELSDGSLDDLIDEGPSNSSIARSLLGKLSILIIITLIVSTVLSEPHSFSIRKESHENVSMKRPFELETVYANLPEVIRPIRVSIAFEKSNQRGSLDAFGFLRVFQRFENGTSVKVEFPFSLGLKSAIDDAVFILYTDPEPAYKRIDLVLHFTKIDTTFGVVELRIECASHLQCVLCLMLKAFYFCVFLYLTLCFSNFRSFKVVFPLCALPLCLVLGYRRFLVVNNFVLSVIAFCTMWNLLLKLNMMEEICTVVTSSIAIYLSYRTHFELQDYHFSAIYESGFRQSWKLLGYSLLAYSALYFAIGVCLGDLNRGNPFRLEFILTSAFLDSLLLFYTLEIYVDRFKLGTLLHEIVPLSLHALYAIGLMRKLIETNDISAMNEVNSIEMD